VPGLRPHPQSSLFPVQPLYILLHSLLPPAPDHASPQVPLTLCSSDPRFFSALPPTPSLPIGSLSPLPLCCSSSLYALQTQRIRNCSRLLDQVSLGGAGDRVPVHSVNPWAPVASVLSTLRPLQAGTPMLSPADCLDVRLWKMGHLPQTWAPSSPQCQLVPCTRVLGWMRLLAK
jgi:hypothetical protein